MLFLLLLLCTKCALVELQTSTEISEAPTSTIATSVESDETSEALTSITPTNATVITTTSASCDVNDTSCATVTKNATKPTTKTGKTTAKPKTASTTPSVPTAAIQATAAPNINLEVFKTFDSEMCTCDLQRQFCDINCCCDQDCRPEDKMVFRSCKQEQNLNRDTSFCQYMDYIYINNTPYAWEVNQNGLFCIAKSNLPARYTLQKKKPIKTLEDAELQKQNKYTWPDVDQHLQIKFNMTEDFIYGANVWIIKNNALEPFQLPDSFVTNMCLIKRDMRFLLNYKVRCSQILSENNPSLNAETYFKDMFIVRAPGFFNVSLYRSIQDCPKNVCLPVETKMCDENYESCSNFSAQTSCTLSIATGKNFCTNVVQKVKYNFYHNGTQGFTKIQLLITLKNMSHFHSETFQFDQLFEVNYFWSNYTQNFSSLLSGNPGYLIGKPVLMANIVTYSNTTNSTKSNKTEKLLKIERNAFDINDNFLIFPDSKRGLCVLNNYTYIASEFGYNMIVKCKIKKLINLDKNQTAVNLCKILQMEIFKYWPILGTNLTHINKLMGSFGNVNETTFTDWIEILSAQTPGQILNLTSGNFTNKNATLLCNNLVTTLKIDIFHARVDYKDLCNQEKIMGATFNFRTPKAFEFNVHNNQFTFEAVIREELMFFDITSERVQKFVDPPSFKISLPYDFFYPFIKVDDKASFLHLSPLVIILCFILSLTL